MGIERVKMKLNKIILGSILAVLFLIAGIVTINSLNVSVASANAEESKIIISGPTEVETGELVILTIENSGDGDYKWLVFPPTKDFLVTDSGKRIIFSSGIKGKFKFIVAGVVDKIIDMVPHTVSVINDKADPRNYPLRIDDAIQEQSLSMKVVEWCELVDSSSKKQDCQKLAKSFSNIALLIEAGTIEKPENIIKATITSNRKSLGKNLDNWYILGASLAKELNTMSDAGKLNTPEDHVKIWQELATALENYAATL